MSAFYIRYPVSGANPSIGAIGQPAPGDATLVAGIGPDGNLHALSTDNSGVLNVNAALAPGGVVTSNQGLPAVIANAWPIKVTDGINSGALVNLLAAQQVLAVPGQSQLMTGVMLGWDGTNHREVSVSSSGQLALSFADIVVTGTITNTQSVTLASSGLSSVAIIITGVWTGTISLEASVDGVNFTAASGVTLTGAQISSNFGANNSFQVNVSAFAAVRMRGNTVGSGTATITIRANSTAGPVVLSEPLPPGTNIIGGVTQSGTWTVTSNDAGYVRANVPTRRDYTVSPVTTGAYAQIVAATTLATKEIEIFDSSGQTLVLATGAAAAEVDQMLIFPGGNGRVKLAIPAGSRVSIKAVSGLADVGENSINYYG